jgi:hypothetical protein
VSEILDAGLVVFADPVQLHLPPHEQKLVTVTHEMFRRGTAAAADFEPLARRFQLDDVIVTLFRRQHASAMDVALETLRLFETAMPEPTPNRRGWVVVSRPQRSWVYNVPNGPTRLVLHPALPSEATPAVAVYVPPLEGRISLSGRVEFVDDRCLGAQLIFGPLSRERNTAARAQAHAVRRPKQDGRFAVSLDLPAQDRLALTLTVPEGQATADYCLLILDDLLTTSGAMR